jgi:hypothetical protein
MSCMRTMFNGVGRTDAVPFRAPAASIQKHEIDAGAIYHMLNKVYDRLLKECTHNTHDIYT